MRARISGRRHAERVLDLRRDVVDVVGVHAHRLGEILGGTGELRQDQHAVVVHAARDVLLGDEVHAVAERRHQRDVGRGVVRRRARRAAPSS